jgi:predicted nucleic acid-binding protein
VVELEFASVVARRVRTKEIDAPGARHALANFVADRAAGLYRLIGVQPSHFAQARAWIETLATSLRTLDALHLALAHGESLPILTADVKLAHSARRLGVKVRLIR